MLHILKLTGFLLLFFLYSGSAMAFGEQGGLLSKTVIKTSGSKETHHILEFENIGEITALLEVALKFAESDVRSEENLKSGKKKFSEQLALQIVSEIKSVFHTYSSRRDKSENIFPLYISHKQLLI